VTPRVLPDVLPTLKPFHPDEEGLLRTCLTNPEDDAPRLILADWYEERGLTEFADYIRYEVTRRFDQEVKPLPRQANNWASDHIPSYLSDRAITSGPGHGLQTQFCRGLPCRCALNNYTVETYRTAIENHQPWLTDFLCYGGLHNEHTWVAEDWVQGLRSLSLGRIRSETLNAREPVFNQEFFTAITVGYGVLGFLRSFSMWGTHLTDNVIEPLFGRFPCSLVEFDFSDNDISTDSYIQLIQSPMMTLVEKLSINGARVNDRFCRTLARSTVLQNLRSLHLGWNRITGTGAFEILESSNLPNLEYLDVRYNKISRMSRLQLLRQTTNPKVQINIE